MKFGIVCPFPMPLPSMLTLLLSQIGYWGA